MSGVGRITVWPVRDPLVSAVIPAFNAAEYIGQAIQSVKDQTYASLECIVVDDGSTDGTRELVSRYSDVILIRQVNAGVSAARNAGVREASGDLVAFLDADDVWLPSKIAKQVELHGSGALFSYTGLQVVRADLSPIEEIFPPEPDRALRNTLLVERPVVSVGQTGMLARHLFDRLGGFDEQLSTSADCDFACRALLETDGAPVRETLVLYRLHEAQLHLRPEVTLMDMELVFDKMWADTRLPRSIARAKRRARANVYVSVAAAYLHNGARANFIRHATSAAFLRPDRFAAAVGKFVQRRLLRVGAP